MLRSARFSIAVTTVCLILLCVLVSAGYFQPAAILAFLIGPVLIVWVAYTVLTQPAGNVPDLHDSDQGHFFEEEEEKEKD